MKENSFGFIYYILFILVKVSTEKRKMFLKPLVLPSFLTLCYDYIWGEIS